MIKNLKIRSKLLLVLSLLLLPLLYFTIKSIQVEVSENEKLQQEVIMLEETELISDVAHAVQKERARILAAAYGDSAFTAEAKRLRGATDQKVRELTSFLEQHDRQLPNLLLVSDLVKYRKDLDNKTLNIQEFRDYSAELILGFLDRMDENTHYVSNAEVADQLSSFSNLAEAKIQLARVRSLLMKVIQDGAFTYEEYGQIRSHINGYDRALSNFSRYADEASLAAVDSVFNTESYQQVGLSIQAILDNPQRSLAGTDTKLSFDTYTYVIEDIRKVEIRLVNRIKEQVNAQIAIRKSTLATLITAVILILVLVSALSVYIINLIATSLSKLKLAAERIKVGATDVALDIESRDEIGSLAASFQGVIEKTQSLSKVAQAIGVGNYDVEVEVQSEEDVLSHALKGMKENLQTYNTESANRNWVLSGVSELNNIVGNEFTLDNLSVQIISFLSNYTQSEGGILYLQDQDNKLRPAASYGLQDNLAQLPVFELNAGKVGQAVSEKRVLLLENIADEYLKIKTGLTEIEPASVIVLPLYFNRKVVGALELCARQVYSPLQRKFLETASERVAVVIHTLKANIRTQELLYETQNQAEELETQQEELRQLNAELKASEEELRVNQEELQEKNTELEEKAQLLEEQYEALSGQNKALEDARAAIELKIQQVETVSKYKSDFLANMSHELRTPLNSILILSRLLADNVENTLSPKQTDHAQIIHKSGNDLLRLINEILDLSKIESGKVKLETEEIKLKEFTLKPLFLEVATRKNIRYTETHHLKDIDTIVTDRFRLEQILKNFIGNALKFTGEDGEVELSVYEVEKRPRFKSELLRDQAHIIAFAVRDNGIGIADYKQEMVFEAFQQADTSTTRKYGGTGLGLTISKELAVLLGGEILLDSQPGKGSTFTLYLPQKPVHTETAKPESTKADKSQTYSSSKAGAVSQLFQKVDAGKQEKDTAVLIIEDDKGFNDILADFSMAKNFKVYQAYTGSEGLQIARERIPDAILLDIQLPDISGWDVLKKLREEKALRHVSVHVMSAYDKEVIGSHERNEEYLPKPVTLEMLNKAFTTIADEAGRSIENILIVEDNEIENRAIAELLLAHSLKSSSAFSAEQAEDILARQKVDCIILDLNLPGMNGYEWMKKLKESDTFAEIPIIIYSGKELSEEEEVALKEFANTVIIKNEYSYLRLLDEVQLFLHKVNQKLPAGNQFKMKLHVPEEILRDKKVLVVDDDVRNIYSLSSLLETQGMEVVVAYNGIEALNKLQSEADIDLVLMDVMMPEMDGIEATKRIRQQVRYKQLPVIALTAKAMKEDKEKCIAAGASDYIPKPVDTEKLLTLMRVWLYEA